MQSKRGSAVFWAILVFVLIILIIGAYFLFGSTPIIKKDFGSLKFVEEESSNPNELYVEKLYGAVYTDGYRKTAVILLEFKEQGKIVLDNLLNNFDSEFFNQTKLSSPDSIYKITNNETYKATIWIDSNYVFAIVGEEIFTDGSDSENILNAYLEKYPSILP